MSIRPLQVVKLNQVRSAEVQRIMVLIKTDYTGGPSLLYVNTNQAG